MDKDNPLYRFSARISSTYAEAFSYFFLFSITFLFAVLLAVIQISLDPSVHTITRYLIAIPEVISLLLSLYFFIRFAIVHIRTVA